MRGLGCNTSEATLAPLYVDLPLDFAEMRLKEAVRARFKSLKFIVFGRSYCMKIFLRCSSLIFIPSIFIVF